MGLAVVMISDVVWRKMSRTAAWLVQLPGKMDCVLSYAHFTSILTTVVSAKHHPMYISNYIIENLEGINGYHHLPITLFGESVLLQTFIGSNPSISTSCSGKTIDSSSLVSSLSVM